MGKWSRLLQEIDIKDSTDKLIGKSVEFETQKTSLSGKTVKVVVDGKEYNAVIE